MEQPIRSRCIMDICKRRIIHGGKLLGLAQMPAHPGTACVHTGRTQ